MDKIRLKNLGFYGYHGVLAEENKLGQKFFVDIEMTTDLKAAGLSDNVGDTINYAEVYSIVKDIVENSRFKLLEALAEAIAVKILREFAMVKELVINIKKPEAPVNGIFDYFAVEIRRKNNG